MSSPSSLCGQFDAPPSSTLSTAPQFATHSPLLLPRVQEPSCSESPNEALLIIATQVLIPDYSSFYTPTPILQFRMSYTPMPDGSLVAPPFLNGIQQGNWMLLFSGMMLMLFLTNTVVSADYIRRGRVKYKGLFYALLVSQLLGVATFVLISASVLAAHVNCKAAVIAENILTEISSALLLSGILGVKAYKCLNDSKVVLAVVGVLQVASSAFHLTDLVQLEATRRFSLTCVVTSKHNLSPFSTALRFVIALFICFCFIYALWKSVKLPAAQGRLSIRLSEWTPLEQTLPEKGESTTTRRRGWWDYVPDSDSRQLERKETRAPTSVDDQGFVQNMRYLASTWRNDNPVLENVKRKGSEATLVPKRQSSKGSAVHFKDAVDNSRFSVTSRSTSPTPSNARSLRSLMNRMKLFREVMRNELAHTACIALFNVIATILSLIGAFGHLSTSPEFLLGSYWGILSLLVIHSFSRVVERHEREALLQHPSSWDPLYHVEKATNGNVQQSLSLSVASNPWRQARRSTASPQADEGEGIGPHDIRDSRKDVFSVQNPFEDFEYVREYSGKAAGRGYDDKLASPALSPRRTSSLLPDAPISSSSVDAQLSAPREQPLSPSSVSKYSDTSSRPRSLFYLEKKR